MGDFTSSSFATYKNHFLIVKIPLKIGQVISIYWIFSGSFLDNLESFFFFQISWRQKKIIIPQMHNTIFQRVK